MLVGLGILDAATSDGLELNPSDLGNAVSPEAAGSPPVTGTIGLSDPAPPLFQALPSVEARADEDGPRDRATTSRPTSELAAVEVTAPPPTPPPQDEGAPSVVARPIPAAEPEEPPPLAPPPPWASSVVNTVGGHVSTDVGCLPASAGRPSAAELDAFLGGRVGPIIGWDYQHVYPLGGDRYLWLFQDAFIDHSGGAVTLGQASFAHNVALVQEGGCFRLLHRGSPVRPEPFETGTGSRTLSTWFWPMGGEMHAGQLRVFWVQMVKDAYDPLPPDGLGWHPAETWVATYDPSTLARLDFRRAANPGVSPIYGYAVASDDSHTYLFGNTFEQNLSREGGYWSGRHSATQIFLARVPLGRLSAVPEYRTADGWTLDAAAAVPILDRHWAEFPFQPRFIDGQWVGVAAVNGYWGDEFSVDVANEPWGPWTTVESRPISPRAGDPVMNTYHAHLVPWRDPVGQLVVTMSNNARDMRRDAWPYPHRYRPVAFSSPWAVAPPPTRPPQTPTSAPRAAPSTTVGPASTTISPTTSDEPSSTTATSTTEVTASTSPPSASTTAAVATTSAPVPSSSVAAGASDAPQDSIG